MKIVLDLEANGLEPTKIWVIHARDIQTGEEYTFFPHREGAESFLEFANDVTYWIGHRIIQYDLPALYNCLGLRPQCIDNVCDTLVLSRLLDFDRKGGHSLEQYGEEFGIPKVPVEVKEWENWNDIFIERCKRDVEINARVYEKFSKYLSSNRWKAPILLEQQTEAACRELHDTGMYFDVPGARELLTEISAEVERLTTYLHEVYQPRSCLVREVTPRAKQDGTLSLVGLNFPGAGDLSDYSVGAPFSRITFEPFNPSSSTQRVDRLWESGWKPTDKTLGHRDSIKARINDPEKVEYFARYGWKTSEENLRTLPPEAPEAAKTLVRYLLLRTRCSKLDKEWLGNVRPDSRMHGDFNGIGAWSGRCSHSNPNMGNIPKYNAKVPSETPYSDRMRSLFRSSPGRYLIGVDAESIQLRILAHYANSETFTTSIISGNKKDGTDPHSLNQKALGPVCTSRDAAKTFIYAWVLDAGVARVAEILGCNNKAAKDAVKKFLDIYKEMRYLRLMEVRRDAAQGYFEGIDGRYVRIPGEDQEAREHYCMAGWLQNGEAVVMKTAIQLWKPRLKEAGIPYWFVNFVHDEYQLEVPRDYSMALAAAEIVAGSIKDAGELFSLRCPMAGSILNSHDKIAIGDTWMDTH